MKRKFFFGLIALVLCAATVVSCNKKKVTIDPTVVTMSVSDIAATTAKVDIVITGPQPSLCRFITATPLETLLDAVGTIDNEESLATYLTTNGTAISLPYSTAFSSLEPYAEYVTGVVCYNSKMEILAVKYAEFKTLAPDNAIGDDDNAGGLTENKW